MKLLQLALIVGAVATVTRAEKPVVSKRSGFDTRASPATSMALYKGSFAPEHKREGDLPQVQAFGYDAIASTDDGMWGIELGLNIDIGAGYELPLYNQDQFLIWRVLLNGYFGGRTYVTINLYWIKFHGFFDLWGAKVMFFDNYMRYDIVNYKDFCDTAGWLAEVARFMIFLQIDVNECLFGLIGAFTDDVEDCDWSTYYINHPLLNVDIWPEGEWEGRYWDEGCDYDDGNIKPYDA